MEEKFIKDINLDHYNITNLTEQIPFRSWNLPNVQATCSKSRCRDNSNYAVVYEMHDKNVIITYGKLQTSDLKTKSVHTMLNYRGIREMQTW